ncbi:hypothetical protein NUW58_g9203 [Xylaria curta]|uniref:Uncharacterized protein n=1 Tax=Xylaria curta TaxID=42375 RepID=A0ACC1MZR7_9PEZI|nr:hypothetical protein NUW58_g9203 [Xylaria curta]
MRHAGDEYMLNSSRRPSLVHNNTHCVDGGGHGYQPASFDYGYHHPNRAQSLSAGSAHFDRASIGPAAYEHPFPESYMRYGNFGMTSHGDGKRKRRGNLPKETTDKLRAWFHAHLTHPYPTEDEKQEFMRRTGLQMNQISNWFINARRRHLPGILNDARAESNAMNSHTTDGGSNALPPNEPTDYDHEGSEESNYDDAEVESAKGGSTTEIERGST